MIQAGTGRLAAATGVDPERHYGWCTAFAAMSAWSSRTNPTVLA
jgi:hypothetical protein